MSEKTKPYTFMLWKKNILHTCTHKGRLIKEIKEEQPSVSRSDQQPDAHAHGAQETPKSEGQSCVNWGEGAPRAGEGLSFPMVVKGPFSELQFSPGGNAQVHPPSQQQLNLRGDFTMSLHTSRTPLQGAHLTIHQLPG